MSTRLNQDREKELQPKRMQYAINQLKKRNIEPLYVTDTEIVFAHEDNPVSFFPYSGWHTGKSIEDGRGIDKLLKQLDKKV